MRFCFAYSQRTQDDVDLFSLVERQRIEHLADLLRIERDLNRVERRGKLHAHCDGFDLRATQLSTKTIASNWSVPCVTAPELRIRGPIEHT